jgi:phosphatidylglycerol:prolipoprotein diacylglycerol transferase
LLTELNFFALLAFPQIDPIAFSIGPLSVRWYGIAYVAGILLAWAYGRRLVMNNRLWANDSSPVTLQQLDDFIFWAAIGIVAGGRIGYVFAYDFEHFLQDPSWLFAVSEGGMSFHGGFVGTAIAMILFARRHSIPVWSLFDIVSATSTIGLLFGRIANFINGELWGRATDVPWAFIFPTGGPVPRHPSQLYEGALEGIALFIILAMLIYRFGFLKRPGLVTGVFVAGYGTARIIVEFFREPDAHIGYLAGGWLTMGMVLSLPMVLAGLWAIIRARS